MVAPAASGYVQGPPLRLLPRTVTVQAALPLFVILSHTRPLAGSWRRVTSGLAFPAVVAVTRLPVKRRTKPLGPTALRS